MKITKERIFAALVTSGAISQTTTGRYFWTGATLVNSLMLINADPVKYAEYLANDLNVIFNHKPEAR